MEIMMTDDRYEYTIEEHKFLLTRYYQQNANYNFWISTKISKFSQANVLKCS